jgi:transposase-like protein
MPGAHPEGFRSRAVSLVVDEGVAAAKVAKDLGIAESGLRRWSIVS